MVPWLLLCCRLPSSPWSLRESRGTAPSRALGTCRVLLVRTATGDQASTSTQGSPSLECVSEANLPQSGHARPPCVTWCARSVAAMERMRALPAPLAAGWLECAAPPWGANT
eukprot:scaffold2250_cov399-Prasinococcus_capsulatus_cf.AAC.14